MSKYKFTSLLCPTEKVTEEQLETDRQLLDLDRSIAHLSRRGALAGIFAAAASATVLGGARSAQAQNPAPSTSSIVDVLNFALNLEYLEANFYSFVTTGSGLTGSTLVGAAPGTPQGAPGKITFDPNIMAIATALALDEKNHIMQLRTTIMNLMGTPIDQPVINFAAKGPVTTQAQFLTAARQFTALGNSAYAGSAQLLVSNTTVLNTAGQILGAEGQHAGALYYQCNRLQVSSPPIDAQDEDPIMDITPTLANALAPARNTSQVLGVAYGLSTAMTTNPTTGVSSGGFFPNGFNGNAKST